MILEIFAFEVAFLVALGARPRSSAVRPVEKRLKGIMRKREYLKNHNFLDRKHVLQKCSA